MRTNPDLDRAAPAPRRPGRRWLLPAGGAALVVVAALLAAFQPWRLFVDKTVNEAVPVAASAPTTAGTAAAAAVAAAPTTSPVSTSVLPTTAVAPAAAAAPTTAATVATTAAPAPAVAPAPEVTDAATTAAPAVTSVAPPPAAEPTPTEFTGKAHATSGTVRLIPQPDGTTVLRLENLNTSNGPDVKVVLSPDPDGYASGSVTLASLKGNKGSQNYVIPADVDLGSIRSVVLWCKRFNVDFAVAPLPV